MRHGRWVLAGVVGLLCLPALGWTEEPDRGPERVLQLFPKSVEDIQPQALDRAVPTVVHNLTKDAPDAKAANAANRPPAAGHR